MIPNQLLFPFLEQNPVFFQIVIGILTIILSIVGIIIPSIISIRNYIRKKQHEAVSGFYINLLVFLKRLQMLLNQCPNIEILFFNEATREKLKDKLGGEAAEQQAKNISDTFSVFCGEFIRYISTSDNNVPPTEKHGSNEWRDWYDELSILIQFLHKGQMIGKHYYYTSVDQYENEYIPDKGELNNTVNNIKKLIEGKLYK